MHPVLSEHELWVLDRRRQELISDAKRYRIVTALPADAPSPEGNQVPHRGAAGTLIAAIAMVWPARRRTLLSDPDATSTSV